MTNEEALALFGAGMVVFGLISIIAVAIYLIPMWKIFARTGMSGALSLLLLVPLVNIIMLYYLAFAGWPIEEELKRLRAQAGGGWPGQQPQQPGWQPAPGQQPQQPQQPGQWGPPRT